MKQHIAFITYETPFSPGGGIAPVMARLPAAVQDQSNLPTYVISPFHYKIDKTAKLESEMDFMGTIEVQFGDEQIPTDLLLLHKDVAWIFLKPHRDAPNLSQFFSGKRHPYDMPNVEADDIHSLLRDALYFGSAVPAALSAICAQCQWTVFLQDWEAATTALYLSQTSENHKISSIYLTLHNSYDRGLDKEALNIVGLDEITKDGGTVLECALAHVNESVFTVSEQFAIDLSTDIFQSEIMLPHIIDRLKPRLVGINNGPFVELQIPMDVYQSGFEGDLFPLSTWKVENRKQALELIDEFISTEQKPVWGNVREFSHDDLPWFVMAGRDDTRQKGYDLASIAIEQFLEGGGRACFIFFPIPGDEGLEGIQFIRELADKHPTYVLVFPFFFREGYFRIMRGASYGMMPSYYEPFGMANEFFLNGISCIARATGGIVQQITPYRRAISFGAAAGRQANRWHKDNAKPSGFLFRETDDLPDLLDDWLTINRADYSELPDTNRIEQRNKIQLIQFMSNEMMQCIEDAVTLYEIDRGKYHEFIINGVTHILDNFSWDKSARAYLNRVNLKKRA